MPTVFLREPLSSTSMKIWQGRQAVLQKQYLNGVEILSVNLNSLLNSLHEIAARIKMQHPEVVEVILFGSFSKNNFTP